ncbi:Complement C1q tumor necrosis factor-related protein 6 [Anabarilius grahami]|uniref:Complement C1q tumor necrosis factor-related protein 6 n=1 Tax=Anabarilius grahami TaxID=495550 RepID=A0A3N0YHG9_ANAGA|nr:Complement C1q tumor necrosis factor-related protein 6 [Anabarilius grahami]
MSCTILYPLLLLLVFSCACISEIQQTERTESLPRKSCAAENQQSCLTGICPLLAELTSTLQANMDQESLRRKDEYNIAFAATLGNVQDVGPFNTDVTLVYNKVFVNAGLHYNPGTGIFTAPVNGVYFFSFSGHNKTSKPMALRIAKNGKSMSVIYNHALIDAGFRDDPFQMERRASYLNSFMHPSATQFLTLSWFLLPFYYDRTESRQEVKWERKGATGLGKVHESELEPGSHELPTMD